MIFIFLKIYIGRNYFLVTLQLIFVQSLNDVLELMQMMISFNELPLNFLLESTRIFGWFILLDGAVVAVSHVSTDHLKLIMHLVSHIANSSERHSSYEKHYENKQKVAPTFFMLFLVFLVVERVFCYSESGHTFTIRIRTKQINLIFGMHLVLKLIVFNCLRFVFIVVRLKCIISVFCFHHCKR